MAIKNELRIQKNISCINDFHLLPGEPLQFESPKCEQSSLLDAFTITVGIYFKLHCTSI